MKLTVAIIAIAIGCCDCASAKEGLRRKLQVVSTSELASANTATKCWIQIDAYAYDVTAFATKHPAGAAAVLKDCGRNVTSLWYAQASHSAALLGSTTGVVKKGIVASTTTAPPAVKPPTSPPVKPPTKAPIKPPTAAPTVKPPTKAPTKAPVKPPSASPTKAPTRTPTRTPTTTSTRAPTKVPTKAPVQTVTKAALAAAKTATKCWIQINTNAYDVTAYMSKHPGGAAALLRNCGTNATRRFFAKSVHNVSLLKSAGIVNKGVVI